MSDDKTLTDRELHLVDQLAFGLSEQQRVVHFSRVEEWLDELRLQYRTLALPYVRLTARYAPDPQIHILQHVSLLAGFHGLHEYVELRSYCGQSAAGDDGRAQGLYQRQRDQITAACEELGVEVRAGTWTAPAKGV